MKVMTLVPPSKFSRNVARDLIYGCWCKGKRIAGIKFPPVSLLLITTILRDSGHNVVLLDAAAEMKNVTYIKDTAKEFEVVIILTSSMSINEDSDVLFELKKNNKNLVTIVYGSQPTFMPKYTLLRKGIDIIVRNEPEYIIRDLINTLDKRDNSWKDIKGIGFKENGTIIINENYPFINNLDELPFPDRLMLAKNIDYFNPVVKRIPYTTMFTARGCPGRCVYCSSPSFYGKAIRYRSAENVINELEIVQSQGYREVFFRDEIFTVSRKRVLDISEGIIQKNIDLTWICSARIGTVDKPMMEIMKKAGCHMIRFGVESGVQKILDNIQKDIKIEQTVETFRWAHEIGLDTHAHLMIGMPGETSETIESTIAFVKKIDPTIITVGICTPYPGTKLFGLVQEKHPEVGDGSDCDLGNLHTKSFYNEVFSGLSNEELSRAIRRFYSKFYLRIPYLGRWIFRIGSLNELRRILLAGTQIFDFIFRGD